MGGSEDVAACYDGASTEGGHLSWRHQAHLKVHRYIYYTQVFYMFMSHLPGVLIHFSLLPAHNSGLSVGLAACASVATATGDGGGCSWCGGRYY